MVTTVIVDLKYFLILFLIIVVTFAECFHILQVNIEPYGEYMEEYMPIIAHIIATLRIA